ncbi:MAG: hypothetical protein E6H07_18470 [Bacteroidetes bacterium]|nr:MAG: hypothetical protein E6H07_18470 [Bacteroidota bacterium]
MKSLLSLACFIFSFVTIGYSQKITEKDVPAPVKTAFNNKFPGATDIKWEKENKKELEANFKMNNADVSANFGLDGAWVETETTIPSSELPAAVTNTVNTKYPGAVYGRTEKIEKPGGRILYEVNITVNNKKKELELNPDGSIAK